MEFRHLRYFVVLAEELHYGRAAKRLSISQPPLSLNIKQLENHLGVVLFERTSKAVKLTPAGHSFRELALSLLAQAREGEERVKQVARGAVSRIRIGLVNSMLFRGLPEHLARFQEENARVEIVLNELNSAEQIEALVRNQIDLAFVHSERVPRDLKKALYLSEPFVCCLPSSHPAAAGNKVSLRELSSEPVVMFSRGASPDYYERILAVFAEQGLQPMVRHEVRHWLSVISLVSKNMGIALVPSALARAGIEGVKFLSIGPSKYRSDVYYLWNERHMPAELSALLEIIKATQ